MAIISDIDIHVNLKRRQALKILVASMATPLLTYPLLPVLSHPHAQQSSPLTDMDKSMLNLLSAHIIPSQNGNPGALEANSGNYVIAFIETQDATIIMAIQEALGAVNLISLSTFGKDFPTLSSENRNNVMETIAIAPALSEFWRLVRSLTVLHFYAQPIGYKHIGLPGPNIDKGGYPQATQETEHGCIKI